MAREYFTLSEEQDGTVWLWGHSVYPKSSVLAGQNRDWRVEPYDSMDEAKAAHPDVEIGHGSAMRASLPDTPPAWFDPAYAGEEW